MSKWDQVFLRADTQKLLRGKVPGVDETDPEMSWLTRLFSVEVGCGA